MNVILTVVGFLVLLSLCGVIVFRLLDRTNGSMLSAGEKRTYLIHVPKGYDASRPTPLVITIHGFVQWPAHQMHISRWNELADEYGFIVVYPSGTRFPKRWRTGAMPGREQDPSADIQFISDLIDRLKADYNIDTTRIFANGLSNGGGMSFLLSCHLADRIAAIGIVAGLLPTTLGACRPSRQVPVMMFHGTADPIVPYAGGRFRRAGTFPSIPEWAAALARRNGCSDPPREIPAKGEVSGIAYKGCPAEVVLYTIQGGGHTWPGGKPIPAWIAGRTSMDIDATRSFWEFFQEHPLPDERELPDWSTVS
jgi:polyhydroxybutyrate depolymerase